MDPLAPLDAFLGHQSKLALLLSILLTLPLVSQQLRKVPGLALARLTPEVVYREVDRLHVSGEAADPGVGVLAKLAGVNITVLGMILLDVVPQLVCIGALEGAVVTGHFLWQVLNFLGLFYGFRAYPLQTLLSQRVGPAKLGLVLTVLALATVFLSDAAFALSAIDPALAMLLVTEVIHIISVTLF